MTALALAQIDGWTLATGGFGDGRQRVLDLELAKKLEFKRPRKIRELIQSLVDQGELPGIHVRPREGRTSMPRGGERVSVVEEFWLTEEEALFVAAKSDTRKANEILRAIIKVFTVARDSFRKGSYLESRILEFESRRDWELLWGDDVVAQICKLYRWPTHNVNGGMYAPLASVFDRLYRLFLGDTIVDEIKRRNPEPSRGRNHHQLLQERVREMVGSDVSLVTDYARISLTPEDWWAKLRTRFRREPYQLTFGGN